MTPEEVAGIYEMRLAAELKETYDRRCIFGEKVFYVDTAASFVPGQIHSHEGVREYQRISGCCEFHFDAMFAEEEVDA